MKGDRKAVLRYLQKTIATGLFSGYAPVAPGTAGSAVVMMAFFFWGDLVAGMGWIALLVAAFFIAVWTASAMEREWGKDPGRVVVDEWVGYLVTVAFLPNSFSIAFVAFLLFRLLDIVKPPPARQLERLPGGWGIVADDVMAGVYGNLLMRLGLALGPWEIV